ncbi:hypothetical protein ACTXT7_016528 [Hymenolepis weldensis]
MKPAIVTGSNKGIGKSIVELLDRKLNPTTEWHIYLTAHNDMKGLEAAQSLKEKSLSAKYHQLGITNSETRRKLTDFVKREYPNGLHVLDNYAGMINERNFRRRWGEWTKTGRYDVTHEMKVNIDLDFFKATIWNTGQSYN